MLIERGRTAEILQTPTALTQNHGNAFQVSLEDAKWSLKVSTRAYPDGNAHVTVYFPSCLKECSHNVGLEGGEGSQYDTIHFNYKT